MAFKYDHILKENSTQLNFRFDYSLILIFVTCFWDNLPTMYVWWNYPLKRCKNKLNIIIIFQIEKYNI